VRPWQASARRRLGPGWVAPRRLRARVRRVWAAWELRREPVAQVAWVPREPVASGWQMRVLLQVRPSGCRMVRRASEQERPWVRVAWEALVAWWARVAHQQSVVAVRRRARQPLASVQAERRPEPVVWAQQHEARYPWVWGAWVAWPVPRERRVAVAWRGRPKERQEHRPWEERAWWVEHRPRWEGAWAED
jgi:hypothetical protein